ncbi:MAG: Gfo/Idh/MocA family oxidoreductase [Eubacteriales bacterium]
MDNSLVRVGVFGAWRGSAYIKCLAQIDGVKVTAVCDKSEKRRNDALAACEKIGCGDVRMFDDYEEFITSGLFDALILCNYFNEHAPVALRALGMGIHVFSETIAASTMAECVALCRAAEKSTAIYQLAENYPFARGTLEMKRLYDGGTLGKVLFAEGEYVHPMSPSDTRKYTGIDGNGEYHWRRYLPATYYCSHALAPLMYMTGEMPKKVIGKTILSSVETLKKYGRIRADAVGVMLVETIGGALFRVNGSSYMAPHGNWYRLSCEEGACETVRGQSKMVRLAYNKWSIPEGAEHDVTYEAQWASDAEKAEACGHGGGDYWVLRQFFDSVRSGKPGFLNVYRAAAMAAVGILGWRSVLDGSKEYTIPDFRNEAERAEWEADDLSPFPAEEKPNLIPYTSVPVAEDVLEYIAEKENETPAATGRTESEIEAESKNFGESNVVVK